VKHLEAAGGARLLSELDSGAGYVLKLLNKYLQWFLSGAPSSSPASSQSSSSRSGQSSASSSPGSTHTSPTCSKALADGIVVCLTHISSIVTAVATTKNLQGAVAGLRPLLVAAGTGELLVTYMICFCTLQLYVHLCWYLPKHYATPLRHCSQPYATP
jgi:hypothetical protein